MFGVGWCVWGEVVEEGRFDGRESQVGGFEISAIRG